MSAAVVAVTRFVPRFRLDPIETPRPAGIEQSRRTTHPQDGGVIRAVASAPAKGLTRLAHHFGDFFVDAVPMPDRRSEPDERQNIRLDRGGDVDGGR